MVPHGPHNSVGWLVFERNGPGIVIPDARFGVYPWPNATDGVLAVPLYGLDICLNSIVHVVHPTDSHPISN